MIMEKGVLQFGAFKLKLHEKYPDAPLAPFYLNLRTADNPKPGPLGESDCELIAHCLMGLVSEHDLFFGAIAGIPNAGDPFVEAIKRIKPEPRGFRIIKLAKEEKDGKRKIVPAAGFDYRSGETVLLLDDLITQADSKFEAIQAVESAGSIVRDVIVLIDRQQGGVCELKKRGYNLFSVFKITDLFQYYFQSGMITDKQHDDCVAYLFAK